MNRSSVAAIAALVVGGSLVGGVAEARSAPLFERTELPFLSETDQPSEFLGLADDGTPRPELCNPVTGDCLIGFIGYDRLSGALTGTQVGMGALFLDPATFTGRGTSLSTFTGEVIGCPGEGTALLRWTAELGVRPGENSGSFRVVKGSGTGGLEGLRGTGRFTAKPDPVSGDVTSRGTVNLRCD